MQYVSIAVNARRKKRKFGKINAKNTNISSPNMDHNMTVELYNQIFVL